MKLNLYKSMGSSLPGGGTLAGEIAGAIGGGLMTGSIGSLTTGIMEQLGFPWWLQAIINGL